jgi:hypothetical protein
MDVSRSHWEAWWKAGRQGAMSYSAYVNAVENWVEEGTHSGPKPSEALAEYTRLNAFRMRRVTKTSKWSSDLEATLKSVMVQGQHWVVITESWCGDAAQTVPLIGAMASSAGIHLDVVLRDEPASIMEDFLTHGARAIPLWIVADSDGNVLGQWGPRPQEAQRMVADFKAAPPPKPEYRVFAAEVQKWYSQDRGKAFFSEALEVIGSSDHV